MTLGWHTVLEFTPSLIGLMISSGNHSFGLISKSGECVVNLPTTALTDVAVGIGNTTGATATNCIDVSGGNGGNGGNGVGTGAGGGGGASGYSGGVELININPGSYSYTAIEATTTTAGAAASGVTGGAGATATAARVSL